jgi:chromosomal replication initiation ATPase DnaA
MKSPEQLMAEHLNGKFFWEHTVIQEETAESKAVVAIRHAQRKFAKGARDVTARNRDAVNAVKKAKIQRIPLRKDQKIIEPVINAIATAYEISVDDLFGRSTSFEFKHAKRHLYWAIFRYHPNLKTSDVGDMLGKNHSTIIHGRALFQKNQDFAKVVEVERLLGLL